MNIFKNLYNYREFLKTSIKKEFRGKYKKSFLGILWSFLNPLFQLLIYALVFPFILKNNVSNYTVFLIVGGGPYLDVLKKLVISEKISDKVIFTGTVSPDEINVYYKLGDVFLSASQSETQGLTYMEALASGLPAVCRKDECLNGVIIDGENGGQYTDFKEFSELIETIMYNDELYKTLSEKAVKTAQKYSAEGFAKNVEAIYKDVLEKRNNYEAENALFDCKN